MTFNTLPDRRTTAQKLMQTHEIMERAIREEAYGIVSMYVTDISGYMTMFESDVRRFIYHDEYVECGILDD